VDEAAVMAVFQRRAAVQLSEESVIADAFALPTAVRGALQRLVARGDLVRQEGDPVFLRRPQDSFRGLLRGYAVRAVLGVAVGLLLAWLLQSVGVLHGSLGEPAVLFAVLGSVPVVALVWRESRYRRRRAAPSRPRASPQD
jgi:NhaP-type Na+/H+ or K+/H+ antiporter